MPREYRCGNNGIPAPQPAQYRCGYNEILAPQIAKHRRADRSKRQYANRGIPAPQPAANGGTQTAEYRSGKLRKRIDFSFRAEYTIKCRSAGVAELADARDLKSSLFFGSKNAGNR